MEKVVYKTLGKLKINKKTLCKHIGKEYTYNQFTEVLGITRYSNTPKKQRQLERLKTLIDFKIKKNKYIILGVIDDLKLTTRFLDLKDYYNRDIPPKFNYILQFILMNILKDKLYLQAKTYVTTYDSLAVDMGFVNEMFFEVGRKPKKVSELLNCDVEITRTTLRGIECSYYGYISRCLKALEKSECIILKERDENFLCIELGPRADDLFFKELKCMEREIRWVGKQFYSKLKETRLKALENKENSKDNIQSYLFLLELFIKPIRDNERNELKNARQLLTKFFN